MSTEKGTPSPEGDSNGSNGGELARGPDGRFLVGNSGGPGNPYAVRTHHLRSLVRSAVTDADVVEITEKLVQLSKAGDVVAIKELLNRVMGKAAGTAHDVDDNADSGHLDALRTQLGRYTANPLIRALRRADGYREGQASDHDVSQAERLCAIVETAIGLRIESGAAGDRFDQVLDRLEAAAVEARTTIRVLPGPLG